MISPIRTKACWVLATLAISLGAPASAAEDSSTPVPAEELLRGMIERLTTADAFSFHAEILRDRVDGTGEKLQFASALDASVRRPDRLYINAIGDLSARQAWYDGEKLTIFDPDHGIYAEMAGAGDVAATLHAAEERYGVSLPLADLIRTDLGARVDGSSPIRVRRLGLHDVDGIDCHHLSIRREQDDVQIWIRAGDRPELCKLVFTYPDEPGVPQFAAVFTNWNMSPKLPDKDFEASLPDGAVKAGFLEDGGPAQ